jgi:hypothetical protein
MTKIKKQTQKMLSRKTMNKIREDLSGRGLFFYYSVPRAGYLGFDPRCPKFDAIMKRMEKFYDGGLKLEGVCTQTLQRESRKLSNARKELYCLSALVSDLNLFLTTSIRKKGSLCKTKLKCRGSNSARNGGWTNYGLYVTFDGIYSERDIRLIEEFAKYARSKR